MRIRLVRHLVTRHAGDGSYLRGARVRRLCQRVVRRDAVFEMAIFDVAHAGVGLCSHVTGDAMLESVGGMTVPARVRAGPAGDLLSVEIRDEGSVVRARFPLLDDAVEAVAR